MHKVINKQAKKLFLLHSQLEEVKNREVELLKVVQDKEEELAKTKEEISSRWKPIEPPACSPAFDTDKYPTNEEENLVQLKNAIITALDEVKEGHGHDWDVDTTKEALDKLEDTIISVIKILEKI